MLSQEALVTPRGGRTPGVDRDREGQVPAAVRRLLRRGPGAWRPARWDAGQERRVLGRGRRKGPERGAQKKPVRRRRWRDHGGELRA